MNDYVTIYNTNSSDAPVRPADIKRIDGTIDSKTGLVATSINSYLKLRTGNESIGVTPVIYAHQKYHKCLQLLSVPKISEMGGDETLRITAVVYDKDAPNEPKCFELINYNLSIAHPKDVVAGLILSLTEGPLAEISYIKLKIDIIRDFADALYAALVPHPISK